MIYRTAQGPRIECVSCRDVVPAHRGRKLGPPILIAEADYCEGCYMKRLHHELQLLIASSRGE